MMKARKSLPVVALLAGSLFFVVVLLTAFSRLVPRKA